MVVQIRSVVVLVLHWFVTMRMRVLAQHRGYVRMQVMAVVVAMGVLVFEQFVAMGVLVSFREVQVRTKSEEGHGESTSPAERAIAE